MSRFLRGGGSGPWGGQDHGNYGTWITRTFCTFYHTGFTNPAAKKQRPRPSYGSYSLLHFQDFHFEKKIG